MNGPDFAKLGEIVQAAVHETGAIGASFHTKGGGLAVSWQQDAPAAIGEHLRGPLALWLREALLAEEIQHEAAEALIRMVKANRTPAHIVEQLLGLMILRACGLMDDEPEGGEESRIVVP